MKKLAVVTGPLTVGGVEIACVNMLNQIDYSQYEVTLFVPEHSFENYGCLETSLSSKVHIKRYKSALYSEPQKIKDIFFVYLKKGKLFKAVSKLLYYFIARLYLKNENKNRYYYSKSLTNLTEEKYDCAIAYHNTSVDFMIVAFNRLISKKKIAWIHSVPWEVTTIQSILYKKSDRIYCVSTALERNFIDFFPIAKGKTEIFRNIIDKDDIIRKSLQTTEDFGTSNAVIIVTVGRITQEKGMDLIPNAVKILKCKNQGVSFKWYIIGDGYDREKCEKLTKQLNLDDTVIFLGERINPYPYMRQADIYVQPSLSEGFCLTIAEAKLLHKPICITPVPAMKEQLLENKNAIFAKDFTYQSLANAVEKLIIDKELRRRFTIELEKDDYDGKKDLKKLYDYLK